MFTNFQVQYHADFEKMKGKKTDVADDPELQRHTNNMKVIVYNLNLNSLCTSGVLTSRLSR
jgi:hypothetical protein